jgi:hypothetical protein
MNTLALRGLEEHFFQLSVFGYGGNSNLSVAIVSQKYREFSMQVENRE